MNGLSVEEIVAFLENTLANASLDLHPTFVSHLHVLIADWRKRGDALEHAEACLSIVEPRSDKAEYLRVLGIVRAAIIPQPPQAKP